MTPFNRDAGDEDRQTEPDRKLRRREQEEESGVGDNWALLQSRKWETIQAEPTALFGESGAKWKMFKSIAHIRLKRFNTLVE